MLLPLYCFVFSGVVDSFKKLRKSKEQGGQIGKQWFLTTRCVGGCLL